jgi:hypothetical protein
VTEFTQSAYRGFRVAVGSAEAPAELLEAADLVVDAPGGIRALLEEVAT